MNIYTEAKTFDNGNTRTININNCTFNGDKQEKAAANVNDNVLEQGQTYVINFTGKNTFNNVKSDSVTGNQFFGFGNDSSRNKGRTVVTIDGKKVWENGAEVKDTSIPKAEPEATLPSDEKTIKVEKGADGKPNIKWADPTDGSTFAPTTDTELTLTPKVDLKGNVEEGGTTSGTIDETTKKTTEEQISADLNKGFEGTNKDGKKETISSNTHEVSSYAYLDITLEASYKTTTASESGTQETEHKADVTELPSDITINVALDNNTYNDVRDADMVKVLRIHENQKDLLDATLSGNILTFKTKLFSTYVIVAFTAKDNPTPDPETPSDPKGDDEDSGDNSSSSSSSKRTEANTPCEEWNHSKNWTWSEKLGKCVYRVTNTSTD